MKILFEELAGSQRAGGIEAATVGLMTALKTCGHQVERRDPTMTGQDISSPDLVHIHGIWSPALARRFVSWRMKGIPCVVTVHGMLEPWALAHKRRKKLTAWHIYQKHLLNQANLLHATSVSEADNLKILGLKARVETIPWGIEITEWEKERSEVGDQNFGGQESKIRAGANAPCSERVGRRTRQCRGRRTVLFVGRIYPVKGLKLLVEAWANVRPIQWKMKIVGPDEAGHQAEVERMIRQAGLEADFEFTGPLHGDALRLAYQEADLFILPSHTENFGMVVAEALANGLPVITTHGSPWELLKTELCGWWVPISSEGIAQALAEATGRSSDDLASMGRRGRAVVTERFSWNHIARRFIGCYGQALGEGSNQECPVKR